MAILRIKIIDTRDIRLNQVLDTGFRMEQYRMLHTFRIQKALQLGISMHMITKYDLDMPWMSEVEFMEDIERLLKSKR